MAATWINKDALLQGLIEQMNAQMQEAAEPVIRKAVEDAEKEIRKRLGVMFIGLLEHSFSVDRIGDDLRILVKHERNA